MKPAKVICGVALALLVFISTWLYLRFPVYTEYKVTQTIQHNIPLGTSQVQVEKFLDALTWKDVEYETRNTEVMARFPSSLVMRGWWFIEVTFTFKNGKMVTYEMKPIKI